ncbi:MAG: type II secretion system major pseudopilin GspG [Acidobacteria bacterium]|nr:type II secretion system major pseudopilin GspG [Acidobacteriota bacterium]
MSRKNSLKPVRRARRAGVTLIEMLVVVTIIALFAALVAPRLLGRADQARVTAAKVQIQNFQGALAQYKLDLGTFPTTEQGLKALREKNYLPKDVPLDPWGREYLYKFPGEHGDEPDIISLGADGQAGGEALNADVVSWK